MPEPKKHKTRGGRNRRRSHLALKETALVPCDHCGKMKMSHKICLHCGFYKDEEVIDVLAKELKKKEKDKK